VSIDREWYDAGPVPGKLDVKLPLYSSRVVVEYNVSFVEDPYQLRLGERVLLRLDQVCIRMSVTQEQLIKANSIAMPAVCTPPQATDGILLDATHHCTSNNGCPRLLRGAKLDVPEFQRELDLLLQITRCTESSN
jgi:hypothetical protein